MGPLLFRSLSFCPSFSVVYCLLALKTYMELFFSLARPFGKTDKRECVCVGEREREREGETERERERRRETGKRERKIE